MLYNISKNQPPRSIKRGDIKVWPWKRAITLLFPQQIDLGNWNLICTFSRNYRYVFWRFWLFSLIAPENVLRDKKFWTKRVLIMKFFDDFCLEKFLHLKIFGILLTVNITIKITKWRVEDVANIIAIISIEWLKARK